MQVAFLGSPHILMIPLLQIVKLRQIPGSTFTNYIIRLNNSTLFLANGFRTWYCLVNSFNLPHPGYNAVRKNQLRPNMANFLCMHTKEESSIIAHFKQLYFKTDIKLTVIYSNEIWLKRTRNRPKMDQK